MLIMITELVVTGNQMFSTIMRFINYSEKTFMQVPLMIYLSFDCIIWFLMIILFLVVFFLIICVIPWPMCHCGKSVTFKSRKLFIFFFSGLILIYVCDYALPTFLFVLVYPTKVIVVAAYFISYLFSVTVLSAITIDVSRSIMKRKNLNMWF